MTQNAAPPGERRVGSPRDAAERLVEECIHRVEDWQAQEVMYSPVGGGLSNSNWRVRVSGLTGQFFMKIPGAGTEAFVDRAAASQAARQAASIGIAPQYVWFDQDTGVEVIEYLTEYRACTNSDLKQSDVLEGIAEMYRQFHASPPLGLTKSVFDMIDEHFRQARELHALLPHEFPLMLDEYRAVKHAMLSDGLDLVPCHNDPMPGNFLTSPGKEMKLIDFEYSSNNERAYDLALIATEMFYDEERTLALIESFYGSTRQSTIARVQVCSALADVKWGLWGCIKRQLSKGDWDFDYQKYGLWKLMRARAKMSDPRWGSWVASI